MNEALKRYADTLRKEVESMSKILDDMRAGMQTSGRVDTNTGQIVDITQERIAWYEQTIANLNSIIAEIEAA